MLYFVRTVKNREEKKRSQPQNVKRVKRTFFIGFTHRLSFMCHVIKLTSGLYNEKIILHNILLHNKENTFVKLKTLISFEYLELSPIERKVSDLFVFD